MDKKIRLVVYHTDDDDPKKCTAKKLARMNHASLVHNIRSIPKKAIVLNPFSEKSLSKQDCSNAVKSGIVVVDCSWKHAENVFKKIEKGRVSRALPFVVAVNPVNYGKPFKLTSLEAFSTALYILGNMNQAEEILSIYKWGPHFLVLNKEPLEDYRKSDNSVEVIKAMREYI